MGSAIPVQFLAFGAAVSDHFAARTFLEFGDFVVFAVSVPFVALFPLTSHSPQSQLIRDGRDCDLQRIY